MPKRLSIKIDGELSERDQHFLHMWGIRSWFGRLVFPKGWYIKARNMRDRYYNPYPDYFVYDNLDRKRVWLYKRDNSYHISQLCLRFIVHVPTEEGQILTFDEREAFFGTPSYSIYDGGKEIRANVLFDESAKILEQINPDWNRLEAWTTPDTNSIAP